VNVALGQWITRFANQRKQHTGETSLQALTWMLDWVDTQAGAYRALGACYGDNDDGLLRWLDERTPRLVATWSVPEEPRAE
jgi:hypothetical protein